MIRGITSILLLALLAACATGQVDKEQSAAAVEERAPGQKGAQPAETRPLTTQPLDAAALRDPKNILSKRSIHFDFDSYVIKDEYRTLVQAHANYLKANPKARTILQGNADERGSREYNLALGQKRADAVRKALEVLGVKEAQVEAVSFGEEKPRATGHDEASWAENRRTDITYQGE